VPLDCEQTVKLFHHLQFFFFHNSDKSLERQGDHEDLRVQLSEAHTRRAPVYMVDSKYLGTKCARIIQAGRLKELK